MLLKGLDEAGRSPSALSAAEMVLIRIAHAADLPAPEEIIRTLGGGARPGRPAAGEGRPAAGHDARAPLNAAPATEPAAPAGARTATAAPAAAGPDEPPPPASLEDYGAAVADTGAPDADDGEDPESLPAALQVLDDPRSFEDVVAIAGRRRDARLKVHLEEHVSLVKFDAAGSLEMALLPGAPPEMANELREKLNKWTGRRWVIALARTRGAPPLGEVRRAREAAELEALKAHPALASVLESFPDARIVAVRPVSVARDDESATG
jgi:DNA polymerase-3 subunit gamma/tau